MSAPLQPRPNPYVGPRPFQYGEPLFGRDREAMDLLDLLIAERIVLLYSPSGAGKTSLMQAALIPELEKEGFQVLPVMRVSLEPPPELARSAIANRYVLSLLLSLEEALPAAQQMPLTELAGMELAEYLERRSIGADESEPLVLIFDQFEEILTVDPTDRTAKEVFFAQVGAALRQRQRWALFAMREEYPAGLDPYLRPIPTRLSTTFRLELLEEEAARLAMEQPARQVGVDFTDAAARKLVNDLRRVRVQRPDGTTEEQPGLYVEPVQLQVVCRRLWEKLPADATQIGEEDVAAVGDVDSALSGYYAERVAAIAGQTGVRERAIREWCDRHLITPQGIRGQVLQGHAESEGLENRAITPLVDAHLVRAEKRRGATWLELVHDRMIEPVRQNNAAWYQANLSPLQRQAALWEEQHRAPGLLLRGEALEEAQRWAADHQDELTLSERDFLAACREDRARRRRRWAIVSTIVSVIAFALVMVSHQYVQTLRAEARANSRQLAAQSLSHLDNRLDLALLLSVEAYKVADTVEARSSLLTGLQHRSHLAVLLRSPSESEVRRVAFSVDGKTLASVSADGTIMLWNVDTRRPLRPPLLGPYAFEAVFSLDGRLLASLDQDSVVLWNVTDGQRLEPALTAFERAVGGRVEALAFNPAGQLLAIGGCKRFAVAEHGRCEQGEIRLWNVAAGQWLDVPLQSHGDAVSSLAFSPDGQTLVSASRKDNSVILWNVPAREPHRLPLPNGADAVQILAFSPDGQTLALLSGGKVLLWNVVTSQSVGPSRIDYPGGVSSAAFSPDGQWLASGNDDNTIILWDVATQKPRGPTLFGHTRRVSSLIFSPDGQWLASGSEDNTIILWDMSAPLSLGQFLTAHRGRVTGVAFSPDGRTLASTSWDQTIRLWDLTNDRPRGDVLNSSPVDVSGVAFSPDGGWLATGSKPQTVILWDVAARQPLDPPLQVDTYWEAQVKSVAFSLDGRLLAWGSSDGTIVLWDIVNRRPLVPPLTRSAYRGQAVYTVAFSPDGKRLAAAASSMDSSDHIRLWDATTGEPLTAQLQGDGSVAFSPDGKRLAAPSDGGIRLWDAETLQSLGHSLISHEAPVTSVAFSPDGQMLTSSADKTISLWGVTPSQPIGQPLTGHNERVTSVAFSPDGRTLASADENGLIIIWDTYPQSWQTRACHMAGRNLTFEEWRQYMGDAEYRATCPKLPIHPSLMEAGKKLARSGNVAGAMAIFQRVLALEPGIALDSKAEAKKLAAPDLIAKGEQLARAGAVAGAVVLFRRALEWDPSLRLDPQAEAHTLAAQALLAKGRQMASDGEVAGADSLFQKAQELDPKFKRDPDEAKQLAVKGLVAQGEKLASDGNVEGALILFQRARALNPDLERGLETEANRSAAKGLVAQGQQSARDGNVDGAVALFQRAQALDPDLKWDAKVKAQELAANGLLAKGEWLAGHGKVHEALAAYAGAQTLDADLKISARSWNTLCWLGSLWGQAAGIMSACEQAVTLAPEDGDPRDSRGLARALTGNVDGAIADFQAFIDRTDNKQYKAERQRWIAGLRAGKNPFTPEKIEKLRKQ